MSYEMNENERQCVIWQHNIRNQHSILAACAAITAYHDYSPDNYGFCAFLILCVIYCLYNIVDAEIAARKFKNGAHHLTPYYR